jgi:alpha-glucosidase
MTEPWWKTAVVYQIYPRSFQDSNRDGVGDLPGIIRRLPYLTALGVDAVWISPIFPSPMKDFGYDICDYTGIDSLFGTMADFDALLAAVYRSGLKLILDFVPNHTSDRHPWFVESSSSRANPKRNWYLWRDPTPDGGPPNNWLSQFGGGEALIDRYTLPGENTARDRGSLRAIATTIAQWTVAIELGTWLVGPAAAPRGRVTGGNGRFREVPGATRC